MTKPTTKHPSATASTRRNSPKRLWLRLIAIGLLVLGIVGTSMLLTPSDYSRLLRPNAAELQTSGDQFETRALELSNQVRKVGKWSAEFPEIEVNGWLGSDLPEKFPQSIPSNVRDLRVSMQGKQLTLYFRFQLVAVVVPITLSATVQGTDEPNQVALQLDRSAAGWFPIPASWWARLLSQALERSGYRAQWKQVSGRPVVIFQLPPSMTQNKTTQWELQAVGCESQKLLLNGSTQKSLPSQR